MSHAPSRTDEVPELRPLLDELVATPEAERHPYLLAACETLGQAGAGPLLRTMLSCPEKWQRDLAAAVANTMGFDPFAEEDESGEAEARAAQILALGFDDSDPPAPAPEVPEAAAPRLQLEDGDEDTAEAVTFLGACVEPRESGGEPSLGPALRTAPGPLVWVAVGLVALAGIALLRYLSP